MKLNKELGFAIEPSDLLNSLTETAPAAGKDKFLTEICINILISFVNAHSVVNFAIWTSRLHD